MRLLLAIVISVLSILQSKAQENFTSYFEPEIEINYDLSPNYSHSFAIENRNILLKDDKLGYTVKQVEIAHFSEFKLNANQSIGLGIQYRFENTFDASEENEFRIVQQCEWEGIKSSFTIKNRFRNEQRFYAATTKYRLRYQFGLTFPLTTSSYLKTETESLLELAKIQNPELEQRVSAVYGFNVFPRTNLEIGTQYRLADYTQDLGHELFILMGIEIDLF